MNRIFNRSLVIGLCAVALSTVVSPLFLKHSEHRRADQAWFSREHDSITRGTVPAEPPQTPSARPDDEKLARQQALIDELTRAGRAAASQQSESEIDVDSPSDTRRSHIYKANTARSAHLAPPIKKKSAERTRKQIAEPSTSGEMKQSEPRVAPETSPTALQSQSGQTDSSAKPTPLREESTTDLPDQTTYQTSNAIEPPTENAQGTGGAEAEIPVPPSPKSRKDVQDELRKARSNGSLPRFGNPDPYGPGGSPSTSN
ncbi:hypothetical protein AWB79_06798 [Caballeronia hypogeia]|uniref:Uncharacterized protein n=1 Tax=Caballeronia hypogeia TaxID=1777140 RepID=A0A158DCD0_9BURK|nr:hypothetical protein [Caballeronia hypogeia]SAK92282.1 hypothetical protein AWB79_06798 [Caballeronia hypogeia]